MHSEMALQLQERLTLHNSDDDENLSNDANVDNDGSSTTEEHGSSAKNLMGKMFY